MCINTERIRRKRSVCKALRNRLIELDRMLPWSPKRIPSLYRLYIVCSVWKYTEILEIIEKPHNPQSNLAVVGLYAYTYEVFDVIDTIKPSGRGELEISSVNDFYAKSSNLSYKTVNGYWGDAGGSISRYAECSMQGAKEADISADEIDGFRAVVFDDK